MLFNFRLLCVIIIIHTLTQRQHREVGRWSTARGVIKRRMRDSGRVAGIILYIIITLGCVAPFTIIYTLLYSLTSNKCMFIVQYRSIMLRFDELERKLIIKSYHRICTNIITTIIDGNFSYTYLAILDHIYYDNK